MGECHGAYGGIMSLEDGFKVKCKAIPECEFAGGAAGEDASALGRPGDAVDGTSDFVGGCMDECGGQ